MASEPPRRMQALPLLIDRLAASMVTLGRLSKIMPNTPIGTRIWPTRMPLGCCFMPMISPIMSGMAASCSQPSATVSMTLGVSLRRSTIGAARPAAVARSQVLGVVRLQRAGLGAQQRGQSAQGLVLGGGVGTRHQRPRPPGPAGPGSACTSATFERVHGRYFPQLPALARCAFRRALARERRQCTARHSAAPAGAAPASRRPASRAASGP